MDHAETYHAANLLHRGQSVEDMDVSGAVDMELCDGQFSIHQEFTVHGSGSNTADH